MAPFQKISFTFFYIILIYLINISDTKPSKKRHHHPHFIAKCTSEFLWEALVAAGKGNNSATNFLANELHTLGFTKNGVRSKSVAANWQSKLAKVPTDQSVFPNLQKLGYLDLTTTYCEECETTDNVEIINKVPEKKPEKITNSDINFKHLVKSINKLFISDDMDSKEEMKIRNKKLRRLLKKFLNEESPCADINSAKTDIKKNSKKEQGVDSRKICLLMIKELLDRGMCEEVNDSFQWTYVQVEQNYREKNSFPRTSVTVEVP